MEAPQQEAQQQVPQQQAQPMQAPTIVIDEETPDSGGASSCQWSRPGLWLFRPFFLAE